MKLEIIEFGSLWYQKSLLLRIAVLRKPLGLSYTQEQLMEEETQYHLALINGTELLAVTLLKPVSVREIKLRQFAVDPEAQKQGYGKMLLQFAEKVSKDFDHTIITMHARETAVNFYENSGYKKKGSVFQEVGIPHFKMEKKI